MGLRLRLNLLLTIIFLFALTTAVIYLLGNARRAVVDELRASTQIAEILLTGLNDHGSGDGGGVEQLVQRLERLPPLRHLRISSAEYPPPAPAGAAPRWFSHLVAPPAEELTLNMDSGIGPIRIVADPSAEIAEAWREVRVTLAILLGAFITATLVLVLAIGRMLRPLAALSAALGDVGHGRYEARLPVSGISDIDRLNERFNAMSAALQRSERDNAALARRSLAIQEEERRHLAHELHDDMGQSITAIKALAVSIGERSDSVIAERAATIVDVSSSIYARVRQMMRRLHPVALDELGLVAALESMVDDWNTHHGTCFCRFVRPSGAAAVLGELDAEMRIGIYRIVQEGLTNIARHAGASEAWVELELLDAGPARPRLSVLIRDNGQGFDPDSHVRGLGLRGIHERVEAMQGEISVLGVPDAGVTIQLSVPLSDGATKDERP